MLVENCYVHVQAQDLCLWRTVILNGLGPVSEAGRCVFLPTVDPSSKTRLLYESKVLDSVQVQAQDLCLWRTVFLNGLGPVSEAGRCVFPLLSSVDPSSKTRLLYESEVLDSVQVQAQDLCLWRTVILNGLGPVSKAGRCVFLPTSILQVRLGFVFLPTVECRSSKTRLLYKSEMLSSVHVQAQDLCLWRTVILNGLGPVSKAGRCVFLPTVDPSSKTRLQYIKVNA